MLYSKVFIETLSLHKFLALILLYDTFTGILNQMFYSLASVYPLLYTKNLLAKWINIESEKHDALFMATCSNYVAMRPQKGENIEAKQPRHSMDSDFLNPLWHTKD